MRCDPPEQMLTPSDHKKYWAVACAAYTVHVKQCRHGCGRYPWYNPAGPYFYLMSATAFHKMQELVDGPVLADPDSEAYAEWAQAIREWPHTFCEEIGGRVAYYSAYWLLSTRLCRQGAILFVAWDRVIQREAGVALGAVQ